MDGTSPADALNICRDRAKGGTEGSSTYSSLEEVEIITVHARGGACMIGMVTKTMKIGYHIQLCLAKRPAGLRTVSGSVLSCIFLVTDCDLPLFVIEAGCSPASLWLTLTGQKLGIKSKALDIQDRRTCYPEILRLLQTS